ncbi:MAG: precorrin-3B C(17)-methyltransferase, partial [Deltaproteobacteria bacterium]|nr:precorrin-3B C(17)-methyltransferase [Deltaproteobacteria bacterium]
SGKRVAMVCSGDPGIYGLAGLVLQILKGHPAGTRVEVDIIPGISALNACSSRLGAPLAHDFAVISLSDILTPWDIIVKRLHAAGQADFVVVIYNPRSRRRVTQLEEAVKIFKEYREIFTPVGIKEYREIFTPVGIVQRAMRQGESVKITTLSDLASQDIDMQTTIIVGNSQTFVWQDRMITPRGYIIP